MQSERLQEKKKKGWIEESLDALKCKLHLSAFWKIHYVQCYIPQ